MKNSKLKEEYMKEEYMKEESFWHVTNKKNLESIRENGLIPKDGKKGRGFKIRNRSCT